MARVKLTRKVKIRGRNVQLRRQVQLASLVKATAIEASRDQLRILAQETRELILDRIYAARPQPPAVEVVDRPRVLQRQDLPFAARRPYKHTPLAQSTVESKAREGNDGRPLIETGALTEAIEVFEGEQSGVKYYLVRVRPGQHRGSVTVDYNKLMRIHEFGSRAAGVPARPVWRPALAEIKKVWDSLAYKRFVKAEAFRLLLRRVA